MFKAFSIILLSFIFSFKAISQNGVKLSYLDSLIQRSNTEKNDSIRLSIFRNIILEELDSNPISCLNYSQKAMAIAVRNNWKDQVAYINRLVGHCYFNTSQFPEALKHFFIALRIDENLDKLDAAYDMNSVAMVYRKEKKIDKAIYYYKKAWAINELDKRKEDIGNHIAGIGIVYDDIAKYDSALFYYKIALNAHIKYGNKLGQEIVKINMGNSFMNLYQFDKAENYMLNGLSAMKKLDNQFGIMLTSGNLADLYIKMANPPKELGMSCNITERNNYYKKAIHYAHLSIQVATQLGDWDIRESSYAFLSEAQAGLGLYNDALESYKQHELFKDSIFNQNNEDAIANLSVQHELDMKSRQIAEREKDLIIAHQEASLNKTNTRNQLYAFLASIGLVIGIAMLVFYLVRIKQLRKLYQVRNTIAANLHDEVGATLSSISMMSQIAKRNRGDEEELLDKISSNSQTMLESMSDIVWSIRPDNDKLGDIVKRIRLFAADTLEEQNVVLNMVIEGNIEGLPIPMEFRKDIYLIAKEAIINIAKYAKASQVNIHLYSNNSKLLVEIADNGIGIEQSKGSKLGGNGLVNMAQRAQKLNGSVHIQSTPLSGTRIIFEMPLK